MCPPARDCFARSFIGLMRHRSPALHS
jgi:hypothetical protein